MWQNGSFFLEKPNYFKKNVCLYLNKFKTRQKQGKSIDKL